MRVSTTVGDEGKKLDITGVKEVTLENGAVAATVKPLREGFTLRVLIDGKNFAVYDFPCACEDCVKDDMPGSRKAAVARKLFDHLEKADPDGDEPSKED